MHCLVVSGVMIMLIVFLVLQYCLKFLFAWNVLFCQSVGDLLLALNFLCQQAGRTCNNLTCCHTHWGELVRCCHTHTGANLWPAVTLTHTGANLWHAVTLTDAGANLWRAVRTLGRSYDVLSLLDDLVCYHSWGWDVCLWRVSLQESAAGWFNKDQFH